MGEKYYQTHIGRLRCSFRIFEMAKLMTHSSAAYSPTLTQTRQRRLLCGIAGRLKKHMFFPMGTTPLQGTTLLAVPHRKDLHTAVLREPLVAKMLRKKKNQDNRVMWEKEKREGSSRGENTTDVFKRRRVSRGQL